MKKKLLVWIIVAVAVLMIPLFVLIGKSVISNVDLLDANSEVKQEKTVQKTGDEGEDKSLELKSSEEDKESETVAEKLKERLEYKQEEAAVAEDIAKQNELLKLNSSVQKKVEQDESLSSAYAGEYLDGDKLVICVTDKKAADEIKAQVEKELTSTSNEYIDKNNVEYKVVEYSKEILDNTKKTLDDKNSVMDKSALTSEQSDLLSRLVSYGVDYKQNCVNVGIQEYTEKDKDTFESIFGVNSCLKYHEQAPVSTNSTYKPGRGIYILSIDENGYISKPRGSLGYKAYKMTNQGGVYGFVTCAHGVYERATNYLYSSWDCTEQDIIGIVYENGFELDTSVNKLDYSFVRLLPGDNITNVTEDGEAVKGLGTVVQGMRVWSLGSTEPFTEESTIEHVDYTASVDKYPGWNLINQACTKTRFSSGGDSGGLVYQNGASGTYQVSGVHSNSSEISNHSSFLKADSISELRKIFVDDSSNFNPVITSKSGTYNNNLNWSLQDNTLYINGVGDIPDFYYAPWHHLYKDIEKIVIGDGIKTIGEYAFYNCYNAKEVIIGKDVEYIKYNAFAWCYGLTSVDIPESVKAINHHAFYHCDSLKEIRFMGEISEGIEELAFEKVEATVYYPSYYYVWDNYIKSSYGGKLEWIPYDKATGDIALLRCYNDPDSGVNVLKWDNISGARKYYIYRSESVDDNYKLIATATNNEAFFDNSSVPNTVYFYYVIAQANKNVISNKVSLVCDCAKPELVVSNIESTGMPYLEWEPVDGASNYVVYRAYDPSLKYTIVATTSDTSYVEENEGVGSSLYYKIVACGEIPDFADSVFSDVELVSRRFPQPTLSVSLDESTGKPKVSGVCDIKPHIYYAYYATNIDGPYYSLPSSLVHEEAVWGQKYYYKIQACHFAGPSSNTSSACSEPVTYKYGTVGVSTDSNSGKPKIYWDTIDNANEYVVYRSTNTGNGYSEIGVSEDYKLTGNTYTFVDDSAVVGITYYYKVEAKIVTGDILKSILSVEINCICKLPQPITTIKNNTSNGKPQISWAKIEGAYGYRIYRSTNSYQRGKLLHTMGDTTCIDYSAEPNKTYYYSVQATVLHNYSASSAFSKMLSCVCKPIVNMPLTVKNNERGMPYLIWKSITGTSNYKVYRAVSEDGEYKEIAKVSNNICSYIDKLAIPGYEYYYKVEALRRINSDEVLLAQSSVKSCVCKCEAPKLRVTNYKINSATTYARLSFGISRGAKSYMIYRSTDNKVYKKIGVISSRATLTYIDKTVQPGVKYYYKVRAIPANGNLNASAYSNIGTFSYTQQ